MFEFRRTDEEMLEYYVREHIAYPEAKYDFTFEERYLVYHAPMLHKTIYYAVDMETRLSFEVCRLDEGAYEPSQYRSMIPALLRAVKYTGDRRFQSTVAQTPVEVIDFLFRELLPEIGYAVREEQITLSKQMYEGLAHKQAAICEAEVGTGKSMAYLVAGFCARQQKKLRYRYNQPVTIATSSIELQKALIEKEIPRLSDVLMKYHLIERPLTAVLRKGKEHYFCLRRYHNYVRELSQHPEKHQYLLNFLGANRFASKAFDLDLLNIPVHLKNRICVKGSCGTCPMRAQCRYNSFMYEALCDNLNLDFQVTNHNLYLQSTRQPHLLRPSSMVIIDEAHKFKGAAESVYGDSIGELDVSKYVKWCRNACALNQNQTQFRALCREVEAVYLELFEDLRAMLRPNDLEDSDRGTMIRLNDNMIYMLGSVAEKLKRLDSMVAKKGHIERSAIRLCEQIHCFTDSKNISVWVEESDSGTLSLCCCPKDTALKMLQSVWDQECSYVLTSGTMSDGTSFDFFRRENGLDRIRKELILESSTSSPFDYHSHTRLYIPEDMPLPSNHDEQYIDAIGKRMVELIRATHGHTAILFTSYKVLNMVYNRIVDQLEPYEVICMNRSNRTAISDFKKSRNAVLFASGSMWEGVDCVGDILSSVIVVRLPFPIRSTAMEEKKKACGSVSTFIQDYAVPEMLMKLRQGAGRLIRSETDTGCLSILDCRAASDGAYRNRVLQALSQYPLVDTVDQIGEFFHQVKAPEYFE